MTVTVKPVLDPKQHKEPAGPQVVTTDPGTQKPAWQYAPDTQQVNTPVSHPSHPLKPITGDAHGAAGGPEVQAPRVDFGGLNQTGHTGPVVHTGYNPGHTGYHTGHKIG